MVMGRKRPSHHFAQTSKMMAVTLIAIILAACASVPPGDFCDISNPIRLSDQAIDAMNDAEVTAALAHNRKGAALCDWRP